MTIFDYRDYRAFIKDLLKAAPKKGYGVSGKLAAHLSVTTSSVSQILSGKKDFTTEQALMTAGFFSLKGKETEYFVTLVNQVRAGTRDLQKFYEKRLNELQSENSEIKNRIVERKELGDGEKGIFYSNWYYSGVRILSSIEKYNTVDAIAEYLRLNPKTVADVVGFLVEMGLCELKNGRIRMDQKTTYLGRSEKHANSHRRNWHLKAIEKFQTESDKDLFYSLPCSLSQKDAAAVHKSIVEFVGQFVKRVEGSPEERVACLNIDWFEF